MDTSAWDALYGRYENEGLVLALGAGVSVGTGLPNWHELLQRLAEKRIGTQAPDLITKLRNAGFGYPAIAGMLKTRCESSEEFAEDVRECLYRDFPQDLRTAHWPNWGHLVEHVEAKNPTLHAVAAICALPHDSPGPYIRNPRIHAIVNFNIDATLRAYTHARYPCEGEPIVRTVERPSKSSHPGRVKVYYMHGYLRFDGRARRPDREAWDKLVLAEHEYFDFFNSPTSLFNYTFLHLLREYSCLFIGLSMQDDNIRRLLHQSTKERIQAYLEEGKDLEKAKSKSCRHFAILKHYDSLDVDELVSHSLRELGTQVIWIRQFNDIPIHLGQMYSQAGGDWNSVY